VYRQGRFSRGEKDNRQGDLEKSIKATAVPKEGRARKKRENRRSNLGKRCRGKWQKKKKRREKKGGKLA